LLTIKSENMKQLLFIIAFVISVTASFAQKSAVMYADYELQAEKPDYDKAKQKIDEAVLHEKSKDLPLTYLVKARVYKTLYQKKKKDEAIIAEAFEALIKADELDRRGDAKGKKKFKLQKEISNELTLLRYELINDGVLANNELKDFNRTVRSFRKVLTINENETFKKVNDIGIDTIILYNVLASAYTAKDYNTVIEFAPKVIETGYQEDQPFLILYDTYVNLKDTANMIQVCKDAMAKYPEKKVFLDQLVTLYVNMGNAQEGITYINQSLEKDPNNASYWFVLGTFYDQTKEPEKALEAYQKALDVPNTKPAVLIDVNYNLGVIFYNKALEEMNKANEIKDYKKFKEAETKALKSFELCIPYFEKCIELNPEYKDAYTALKPIYYRLSSTSKEYSDRYKKVTEKLDSL
jgi:tetratricopeptide (TPR) repeat protein